jgi:hypothetical protein
MITFLFIAARGCVEFAWSSLVAVLCEELSNCEANLKTPLDGRAERGGGHSTINNPQEDVRVLQVLSLKTNSLKVRGAFIV